MVYFNPPAAITSIASVTISVITLKPGDSSMNLCFDNSAALGRCLGSLIKHWEIKSLNKGEKFSGFSNVGGGLLGIKNIA